MKPIRRVALAAIAASAFILGITEPVAAHPDDVVCRSYFQAWAVCINQNITNMDSCRGWAQGVARYCFRPE